MTNIPMFLICDDNYSPYMATMIASICSNTNCHLEFHAIGKGISDINKQKIENMKNRFPNFDFDYKVFDASSIYNISYLYLARMTASTFIRMALPDLYPNVKRALIMDVDMISLGDISELWNIDLENFIFAASLDEPLNSYYEFKKNLEVDIECEYVNCGLMLVNCEKWRKCNITQKCLKTEKKYREKLLCADQDVINKVFLGNFKKIDSRFNSLLGNEDNILNRHFCYLRKPWFSKYNVEGVLIKNFEDWWQYAKMTPFYNELIEQYNKMTDNGADTSSKKAQDNYQRMEMISHIRNKIRAEKIGK